MQITVDNDIRIKNPTEQVKKWAKMYGWKKANGKLYEVGKMVSTNPIAFLDDIATYEMSISPKEEI